MAIYLTKTSQQVILLEIIRIIHKVNGANLPGRHTIIICTKFTVLFGVFNALVSANHEASR